MQPGKACARAAGSRRGRQPAHRRREEAGLQLVHGGVQAAGDRVPRGLEAVIGRVDGALRHAAHALHVPLVLVLDCFHLRPARARTSTGAAGAARPAAAPRGRRGSSVGALRGAGRVIGVYVPLLTACASGYGRVQPPTTRYYQVQESCHPAHAASPRRTPCQRPQQTRMLQHAHASGPCNSRLMQPGQTASCSTAALGRRCPPASRAAHLQRVHAVEQRDVLALALDLLRDRVVLAHHRRVPLRVARQHRHLRDLALRARRRRRVRPGASSAGGAAAGRLTRTSATMPLLTAPCHYSNMSGPVTAPGTRSRLRTAGTRASGTGRLPEA